MDPDAVRLISYGAATLRVLAETQGLSIGEMEIPPGFLSPPPAIHNGFDEAIYIVTGQLTVLRGHEMAQTAMSGSLFVVPRGTRHAFANETDQPTQVLGMWSPGSALRFIADIGAVLPTHGHPKLDELREVYRRHHSELDV